MEKTRWFGHDCLGNTPHAETIEGTCIQDIYEKPGQRFFNQKTGERGDVKLGADGELHFISAPKLVLHQKVVLLVDDQDHDQYDKLRHTPAGTIGEVFLIDNDGPEGSERYNVGFPNGAWMIYEKSEVGSRFLKNLDNTPKYLITPYDEKLDDPSAV